MIVERVSSNITWINTPRDFLSAQLGTNELHNAIDLSSPENSVQTFYCRVEHERKGLTPGTKDASVQKLWCLHLAHNIKYASIEIFLVQRSALATWKFLWTDTNEHKFTKSAPYSALIKSISYRCEYKVCDKMKNQQPWDVAEFAVFKVQLHIPPDTTIKMCVIFKKLAGFDI